MDWIGSHQQPSLSRWTALRVHACIRAVQRSGWITSRQGAMSDESCVMSDPPYHASTKSCRVNGLPTRPHHTLVIRWRWVMMLNISANSTFLWALNLNRPFIISMGMRSRSFIILCHRAYRAHLPRCVEKLKSPSPGITSSVGFRASEAGWVA